MNDRAEFRQGCDYLNRFLPAEEKLSDVDHILDLIDFDKSHTIELNEFFEVGLFTLVWFVCQEGLGLSTSLWCYY